MQRRFLEYKQTIGSFEANQKYLGILEPGRYRGFDTLTPISALGFDLEHTTSSIAQTNKDNSTVSNPTGIILTKQGVVIQEDSPILSLNVDTNLGNGSKRYDLVVCEHTYEEVVGGESAVYSIIKGTLYSPTLPTLTDPNNQVIVGIIELAAGASTLVDAIWTPSTPPSLANDAAAKLNTTNYFTKTQATKWGTSSLEIVGNGVGIKIKNNGNNFNISIGDQIAITPSIEAVLWNGVNPQYGLSHIIEDGIFPEGSEITIQFSILPVGKKLVRLQNLRNIPGKLYLNPKLSIDNYIIITDGSVIRLKKLGDTWVLLNIHSGGFFQNFKNMSQANTVEEALISLNYAISDFKNVTLTYTP